MADESAALREAYRAVGALTKGLESIEKALERKIDHDDRYREQREERDDQRWAQISATFPAVLNTQMMQKEQGTDIDRIAGRMEQMGQILSTTANLVDTQGKLLAVHGAELADHKKEVAALFKSQQSQINSLKWWRAKWNVIGAAVGVVATVVWGIIQMFGQQIAGFFTGSPPHP